MPFDDAANVDEEINPFDIRVLSPKEVRLFRTHPDDAIVRLTIEGDRSYREIRAARAMPFSNPAQYIGLRDGNDKDIGLIVDADELDEESRNVLAQELDGRYFTPRVLKVQSVKEQMGTVTWDVDTDRGFRHFTVRNLRDNAFSLGPDRLMMTDTENNRYEFPDITAYGQKVYEVLVKVT